MPRQSGTIVGIGEYSRRASRSPEDIVLSRLRKTPFLAKSTLQALCSKPSYSLMRLVLAAEGGDHNKPAVVKRELAAGLLTHQRVANAVDRVNLMASLLTPRQSEAILHYLVFRGDCAQAAKAMGLARNSVTGHVNNALEKVWQYAPCK